MKKNEKTTLSKQVYKGKILNVYANEIDIEGEKGYRELIEHSGGVCVCAIDENNEVIVVEQYRYGTQKFMIELVAGKLGYQEDPLVCAQRELLEESGYHSTSFTYMGSFYPTPAYNSEKIACYMATDLTFIEQNLDPGEHLEVRKIPLKTLKSMILNHEIEDGKTIALVLKVCAVKGI